jgi:hypothetical protein
MNTPKYLTILGCVMLIADQAHLQAADQPVMTPAPVPTQPAQDQSALTVKVAGVEVKDPRPGQGNDVALGDFVILKLDTPWQKILTQQKSPANKLGLFINDLFMKGLAPMPIPEEPRWVMFHLKRNADNRDAWSELFGNKSFGSNEELELTIGLQDGSWAAQEPKTLRLEYFPGVSSGVVLGVAILIAVATVYLGKTTTMLRDSCEPPSDGGKRSYSLARFQMALWFVTVVLASGFTYAVTGDLSPIPQGTLILMGIGAGTAVGAAAIDLNKRTASKTDQTNLTAEKDALPKQIQDLQAKISSVTAGDPNLPLLQQQLLDAQKRLSTVSTQLTQLTATKVPASKWFLPDILSDDNGISFHRLQVFGWTLVFWAFFMSILIKRITMVDFDTTQLALMGISGSTYLGFKLQEK